MIVSHDRHLLRASVDMFWRVAEGKVEPFDGDLDDYHAWLKARETTLKRQAHAAEEKPSQEGGDRKAARRAAAELREQTKPLRKRRDAAEKALETTQKSLTALEETLADPGLYDDARKEELTRRVREQGELQRRVEALEAEWMEAEEALEALEAELTGAS